MRKLLIAVMALSVTIGIAGCNTSSGGGSTSSSGSTSSKPASGPAHAEDVAITACAADPTTSFAEAKVTVTNHSSKTSNYAITIAFESQDGKTQIGTGLVAVTNLAPGQQSPQDANSLVAATGPFTCKVAEITRYAAA
ncbi:conserved exported hypothetical protein [Frankia sp. AiPs1]|uniref:hypothetical protein n=1 Tax=Frankia sp. AiPa1 TaxID=573492 RepID=UPI00202AEC0A|nr:hypothetical protein [Frankia sp. AiPa1]MCL9762302.1 hypothetical protein [Frankia sp. AiPa1]